MLAKANMELGKKKKNEKHNFLKKTNCYLIFL